MKPVDLDKVELLWPETLRLFAMRFRRRVKAAFLGSYLEHMFDIDFVRGNVSEDRDPLGAPISDGTYSLTDTYYRYCARRRRKFFEGSVWPCILSGVVSLLVSYLAAKYLK